MVIDPKKAKVFIAGYTVLLAEVYMLSGGKRSVELLNMLSTARDAVVADPSLLDAAVSNLEVDGRKPSEEVLDAVRSLKVRRWVFLRDTTRYSVFMDLDGREAYAVLGLTDRLSDIVGGTGVMLKAGVLPFQGAYICDGIISNPIWLGANYRKEYSDAFASLKKSGRFYQRLDA